MDAMGDTEPLVQGSGAWETKALERHKALQLDYRRMLAWNGLVSKTVGIEWADAQSPAGMSRGRTLADDHPLHRLLNEGTDTALITVSELGQYLEAFASDPAMPQIAKDLISPKFFSTLFELAMAYRWRLAGGEIALQAPAAAQRVGDFSAMLNDVPFLIEASNISTELYEQLSFRTPLLIKNAAASALSEDAVVQIRLIFRSAPDGEWEQALRKAVKECGYELGRPGVSGKTPVAFRETSWFRLEAQRLTLSAAPELAAMPAETWDVKFDEVTESRPHRLRLQILIRFPQEAASSGPRILKKLIREARQLRGVRGARGVLLDVTGVEPDALQLNAEDLRLELLSQLTRIPELAFVWLVTRGWTTAMRYQYRVMHIPNPESPFQLPHSFMTRFVLKEWKWDFLGGVEIEHATEEEAIRRFYGRQPVFEGHIDKWP